MLAEAPARLVPAATGRPIRRSAIRLMLHTAAGRCGVTLAMFIAFAVLIGPSLWNLNPNDVDYTAKFLRPSASHPFGTDGAGRDQFARVLAGGRASLGAAGLVLIAEVAIGVVVGLLAGLVGGRLERVLMRFVDIVQAIPSQVLALAIVGALGPGLRNLIIALVAAGWATYARVSRGVVRSGRSRPDLIAAQLFGVPRWRIAAGHVVPGVLTQVAVLATLGIGSVIVSIAGLSFLGLGVQPPASEWGAMLNESRFDLVTAPWLLLGPAVAILLCVTTVTLLGDTARDLVERTGRSLR